jgi:glyoxylase-like metal-dependent hydrolase (beta-lactamase superfamily II)
MKRGEDRDELERPLACERRVAKSVRGEHACAVQSGFEVRAPFVAKRRRPAREDSHRRHDGTDDREQPRSLRRRRIGGDRHEVRHREIGDLADGVLVADLVKQLVEPGVVTLSELPEESRGQRASAARARSDRAPDWGIQVEHRTSHLAHPLVAAGSSSAIFFCNASGVASTHWRALMLEKEGLDMTSPMVNALRNVAPAVDLLGTHVDAPGFGRIAMNAFLLRSKDPVLVDAGMVIMGGATLAVLESLIDPADLRWIYLTHVDADHLGCIDALLERAPRARIVTTFLGMAKLGCTRSISPERFFLLNPGQELDVGDRRLLAVRPPCYDAPETTMLFDATSRTLFSSDYFGAFVPTAVEAADEVPAAALRDGMMMWLAMDSPWLRSARPEPLAAATRAVLELQPEWVLSTHLAPARGMAEALTANVHHAHQHAPLFPAPDQAAFERVLRGET